MLNIKMTSLLSFLGSGGHILSILKYCVIYPNRLWTQQMVMWVAPLQQYFVLISVNEKHLAAKNIRKHLFLFTNFFFIYIKTITVDLLENLRS